MPVPALIQWKSAIGNNVTLDNPISAGNTLVVVALFNHNNSYSFIGAAISDTQSSFFYYEAPFQVGIFNTAAAVLCTASIGNSGSDTITVNDASPGSSTQEVIVAEFSGLTINLSVPASVAFDSTFTTNQPLAPDDVAFAVLYSIDNTCVFSTTSGDIIDQVNGPSPASGSLGLAYSTPSSGNGEIDGGSTQTGNYVGTVTVLGPVPSFTLTTAAGVGGSVTPSTASYPVNTPVDVTAIASTGYLFTSWSGDYTGTDNPTVITMNSDKSVTANFAPGFTLTTAAGVGGSVVPTTASYPVNALVTITAIANGGYVFTTWSGDYSGTDNPTIITLDADKSVTANFVSGVSPTMSIAPVDNLNTILNAARTRLQSDMPTLYPVSGRVLDRTQAATQQGVNNAWRKMQESLANLGLTVLTDEVILLNVPAVTNLDPATQCRIDWTSYFDGTINTPGTDDYNAVLKQYVFTGGPVLPSNCIQPLKIWERASGQNAQFPGEPMEMILDGLPTFPKTSWNRCWEWRNNAVWLAGSVMAMDLRIKFIKFFPDFADLIVTHPG